MIHPFLTIHICSLQKKQSSRCVQMPEACNFVKKETPTQAFSCEPCEIFKNTFFIEHLWWLKKLIGEEALWETGYSARNIWQKSRAISWNHLTIILRKLIQQGDKYLKFLSIPPHHPNATRKSTLWNSYFYREVPTV